ncbi:MAG: mechanosensitive ion channel [Anaerolineales bacterium]|nr:mechanosensitive ion channel [Anaerolineales bacterium]
MIENILAWLYANPDYLLAANITGVVALSLAVFFVARRIVARALYLFAEHTETKVDDIVVEELKPYRFAWIAPLLVLYYFTYLVPEYQQTAQDIILILILWLVLITVSALLDGVNVIYESRKSFTGVPIKGYLDLAKIFFYAVGAILTVSKLTGESPVVLLTGLGALTAVLLLIFQNTILSFVASIQMSANDLVKEGDWIEVPSYSADGDVIDITLHSIKIQNWDKTISVVPTYKMMDVAFKNWRGMQASGGRRIKRSINIDLGTIKFVDEEMAARFKKYDLIKAYLESKEAELAEYNQVNQIDNSVLVNGRRLTNIGTFRAYVTAYLHSQADKIHTQGDLTLLVRQLDPGPTGLPIELYLFTKTTAWAEYENIQADIFDHLLSVVPEFDLKVFQNPTGDDFSNLAGC